MVVDDIKRDLPATNRAFHESTEGKLRLVEHETVAGIDRQGPECNERIDGQTRIVARQRVDRVVGREEPATNARQACRVEFDRHEGFGNGRRFQATQSVIDAVNARIVVRATGCHDLNRLPWRRPAANQFEIDFSLFPEMKLSDVPMFVDIAGDQAAAPIIAVQHILPERDLPGDCRCRRRWWRIGCASFQPVGQGRVFRLRKRRQTEGHAPAGVMSSVIVHAFGTDTDLGSIQRKIHILAGDWPTARPRIVAFHRQQAIHHTTDAIGLGLLAAFIEHREKSPGSPFAVVDCIKTETGWRTLDQAGRIDLRRIGATGNPGVAAQVQLTRRVVAGMTGDATMI